MEFKLTTTIGDGLAEAPPYEVAVEYLDQLANLILDELEGDSGPMGVGFTLTIERTA